MDVSIMFVYTTDYIGYWYVNWILTIYIQISLKKKEKKTIFNCNRKLYWMYLKAKIIICLFVFLTR